ncbi:hypothetical protein [Fictibacillus fluitans]|uniref:Uncharacterized protein n=1 Tax=Fictibacillus fluitans TaxID=3058422 RepID=A0ABT8I068_9BACL|nr:hypothetical protein [Fictibacillus sp. NE201]MDN4526423.1 hypothetical protein [Fictibacillus sp. NE201]
MKHSANGCLCSFFEKAKFGDLFVPILKSQSVPAGSVLTFLSFDEKTHCVSFNFDISGLIQLGVLDCSKIAGVITGVALSDFASSRWF